MAIFSKREKPPPVKLIVGFLFKEIYDFNQAKKMLMRYFGASDWESDIFDFTHTDYYHKELGSPLKRKFISFKRLISAEKLAKIKDITRRIERKLSENNRRRINIDPGYLDLAKLVLASTKDYSHRIYLQKGIYAEVTLYYQNNSFHPWPWTYPDYKTADYLEVFNKIRQIYHKQIRSR